MEEPRDSTPAETMVPAEEPRDGAPTETMVPAEEPREGTPAEAPARDEEPAEVALAEVEERGQLTPDEDAAEETPAALGPVVIEVEAESETLTSADPVGEEAQRAENGQQAQSKSTTVRAAEEATVATNDGEAEPTSEEKAEEAEPESPPAPPTARRAVRKVPSLPPRPPPRFTAMEDARQVEHLLERLHLPAFRAELS